MANPTPTLRKVLHSLGGDDHITIGGVRWRAEQLLQFMVVNNDPRLNETCVEGADGTFILYTSGGAVDATTPTMKAVTHKNKNG